MLPVVDPADCTSKMTKLACLCRRAVCHLPGGLHLLLWAGLVGSGAAGGHPSDHHPSGGESVSPHPIN